MKIITIPQKIKLFFQKTLLGLFVLGIFIFARDKFYPLIHGPVIDVTTLRNGSTLLDPMIRISGKISFAQQLIVNGKNLPLDPKGVFDDTLLLNQGYNIVNVQGIDRFGKSNTKTYTLFLKEKDTSQKITMTSNTLLPLQ